MLLSQQVFFVTSGYLFLLSLQIDTDSVYRVSKLANI